MQVIGYNAVNMIEIIIDDVTYHVPDDMGNRYRQMVAEWEAKGNTIPPYTVPLNIKIDTKVAELEAHGQSLFNQGFAYDFGKPYGVLHLQMRNDSDKANWLVARMNMNDAIMAGYGDERIAPIHTAENITVMVTPKEGVNVLVAMNAWGMHLYSKSWEKKAEIRALESEDALNDYDVTEGWDV